MRKTGYSRPHTVHCGPEGIYISTLGGAGADGTAGPAGHLPDGLRELRGAGHAGRSSAARRSCTTTSGGTCRATTWCRANGACRRSSRTASSPKTCSANRYGHRLHFWELRARRHVQTIDLGANHQMALEIRPAHDPTREYGFLGVVVDTTNLEGSIWTWYREDGQFHAKKTAIIPPEPADAALLPALLKGFGAVPPLISDIDLSLDDRFLYVACWGTGELRQYDVTDPMKPQLAGSVRVGGIAQHDAASERPAFGGGPQMTEISRDGKRVYFTNSLYSTWDKQFYPDGVPGAQVMCNVGAERRHRRWTRSSVVDFGAELRRAPDPAAGRRLLDRFVLLSVGLTTQPCRRRQRVLWLAVVAHRRLSRPESGDGLAARRGQRPDRRGATRRCSPPVCRWARGHLLAMARGAGAVRAARLATWTWGRAIRIGAGAAGAAVRRLQADRAAPPALRWRASGRRNWSVVVPDGHRARRRADAGAVHAGPVRRRPVAADRLLPPRWAVPATPPS